LAWSASETAEDARFRAAPGVADVADVADVPERDGAADAPASRIALEIHPEEIVAVLRHRGRIVSARAEGRMERPLDADWLLRLVADWRAGGVHALDIVCCEARDEAPLQTLREELALRWGQLPRLRDAAAARRGLLECLTRQHGAQRGGNVSRAAALPVIHYGEPPRPAWKRAGFWHLLCPLLVLLAVTGVGVDQRLKIKAIQTRFDLADFESKRRATVKQQEAGVMIEIKREKEELDAARHQLIRLMPEVERLQTIEGMASRLPRLLRVLARNISDDVVLETVRNSRSGGSIGDIMILAWTLNYGSAQAFALRVQEALTGLGYAVAQTEVTAGPGRDGRPGYFVSFWLLPRAPAEELGLEEGGAAATGAKAAGESTR
ncbi:MAG: hypothetical protein LBU45_00250, partial [Azoarcus sp.]|nr:hypothetical protein [Azoarcus sp.]